MFVDEKLMEERERERDLRCATTFLIRVLGRSLNATFFLMTLNILSGDSFFSRIELNFNS